MPRINISQTIADEYLSRCVWENVGWEAFPEQSGRQLYVSQETCARMLSDAEFQADLRGGPEEMPPTIRRAYVALAKQLRKALEAA